MTSTDSGSIPEIDARDYTVLYSAFFAYKSGADGSKTSQVNAVINGSELALMGSRIRMLDKGIASNTVSTVASLNIK